MKVKPGMSKSQTPLFESLSALVDNQATELELRRLLNESETDLELRSKWGRLHLARAAIQGDRIDGAGVSKEHLHFADSVRNAIADIDFDELSADAEHSGNLEIAKPTRVSRWKAHTGRFAIAASVAGVVLISSQQYSLMTADSPTVGQDNIASEKEPTQFISNNAIVPTINIQPVSNRILQQNNLPQQTYSQSTIQQQFQDEWVKEQIRQFMLEQAENSSQNNSTGLLPYARVPEESVR